MSLRSIGCRPPPPARLGDMLGRALLAVCLLVLAGHPAAAYAEEPPPEDKAAAAAAAAPYLRQLLDAINRRREAIDTPALTLAAGGPGAALAGYLEALAASLEAAEGCAHGLGDPPRYGWDAVAEAGIEGAAADEVLTCPDGGGHWTPERVAEAWWHSPRHWMALYGDPATNLVACAAYGPYGDGAAYRMVLCVMYRA